MRLHRLVIAALVLAGCASGERLPVQSSQMSPVVPVRGLTYDQLSQDPTSCIPAWGSQRVQVAPGYRVNARVELTSHGNGLLTVEDNDGECLCTGIYDMHAEHDPWRQIAGGMFNYEFTDDDHDGELELLITGGVELHDDDGLISRWKHYERWDREKRAPRTWRQTHGYKYDVECLQKVPEPPVRTRQELGYDAQARFWCVDTLSWPACWDYQCEVRCDGRVVDLLYVRWSRMDPEFELHTACGQTFLTLAQEGIHGTGASSTFVTWYSASPLGLNHAHSFYRSGYVNGWGQPFDRELAVSAELIDAGGLVLRLSGNLDVLSAIGYEPDEVVAPGDEELMFTATAVADYRWDVEQQAFVPADTERAGAVEQMMLGASDYLVEHFFNELLAYVHKYRGFCAGWLRWLKRECNSDRTQAAVDSLIVADGTSDPD